MPAQQAKSAADANWTIRNEKGTTFGPASLETLRGWARDGRIAPTSEASANGTDWVSVTALDLSMDWIAEISPATFYGPIHRNALEELLREGSLAVSAAVFKREKPGDADAARQHAERVSAAARREALAHAEALEQQIAELQRSLNRAQADLKARDHEFDAERQELKAAQNRMHAESIKKESRIVALETENGRLESAAKDSKAMLARLDELESALAQSRQDAEDGKRQADLLRQSLHHAEQERAASRAQTEHERHELEAARNRLHAQTSRIESARRLSQQLAATLATSDEPATEDAVIVTEPAADALPPIAPPAGKKTAASLSLADLEAQAQRELRQIGETGNGLFKRGKKT